MSDLKVGHTHITRLCRRESTARRPVISSSSKTPNANTSVFSSTIPCIKYSGDKYLQAHFKCVSSIFKVFKRQYMLLKTHWSCRPNPNVPSIGKTMWWDQLSGSHFASPKSEICSSWINIRWSCTFKLNTKMFTVKVFNNWCLRKPELHNLRKAIC